MPTLAKVLAKVALKLAPLFFKSFVRHYYDKFVKGSDSSRVPLRDEELLYDQVFLIAKQFMKDVMTITVEELQDFTRTRTSRPLSPPRANVFRTLVPLSCCDAAALYLIKAFGGEDTMKQAVGGTKWWQVRSVEGVEAEWVIADKDPKDSLERGTARGAAKTKEAHSRLGVATSSATSNESSQDEGRDTYRLEMDGAPCILYIHGGGYYFGSADGRQGTMIQYAQMIQGRLFIVDYRLAPQFPFPCAIQDVLAAYLYLIQPPIGASHRPVNPNKVIISGDSAGGGLALALLQVIRDATLPLPAGGVLVSPWCDLTHSFHSITTNTDTDVLPDTGLSLHKPSLLWPPPSEDFTSQVHAHLRKFADGLMWDHGSEKEAPRSFQAETPTHKQDNSRADPQFQFYVENRLLRHPLVSPALSYLGGLPPLFFVAGDGEVLRDEIVYTAHRAAHPEEFPPLSEHVRVLFRDVQDKMRCTAVHLQIYDDAAHTLPILFPFSTPGKFCMRSIATFIKQVTGTRAPSKTKLVTPIISAPSVSSLYSLLSDTSQCGSPGGQPGWEFIYAGDSEVYDKWGESVGHKDMIRERISTQGIVRPLEHEDDLPAFTMNSNLIGVTPESVLQRYLAGKKSIEKKYASVIKKIAKQRARNIERARYKLAHRAAALRPYVSYGCYSTLSSPSRLAWMLDASECPPPSSTVGRLDMEVEVGAAGCDQLLFACTRCWGRHCQC